MFSWEKVDQNGDILETMEIPGEIHCFVDLNDITEEEQVVGYDEEGDPVMSEPPCKPGIYAVVNSLCDPPQPLKDSVLLKQGKREMDRKNKKKFTLIDVNSILDTAYVFPNFGTKEDVTVHVVNKRMLWSNEI